MQFVGIVLFSIAAAVFYGIAHDQVTARVCVEYFTIGHPPVFHTTSPTLLALGWGALATWWVGLPLGIFLACASRLGAWPRLTVRDLVRPLSLESAATVNGPYTTETAALIDPGARTITLSKSGDTRFYRLRSTTRYTLSAPTFSGNNVVLTYQ